MSVEHDEVFKDNSLSDTDTDIHDVKKNLLSELDDDSPEKQPKGSMAPPPPPQPAENASEKMQVYLRIRPLKEEEKNRGEDQGCAVVVSDTRVDMVAPKESKTYEHSAHGCGKVISTFSFTHVYDQFISQRVLFEESMLGTCKDFIDGQNCLVFAYGVTSSGKTYTMQGPPRDPGIIPQSLEVIFNTIGDKQYETGDLMPQMYTEVKRLGEKELCYTEKFKRMVLSAASRMTSESIDMYSSNESLASQSSIGESMMESMEVEMERTSISSESLEKMKFSIWISFAEVYNEQIHDLLEPVTKRKALVLREDKKGNPYIKDLKHVHVRSTEEALKVLTYGQKNLQYAYTKLNESSSRSHCIFNIKMIRVADKLNPNVAGVSQLAFCDLAGSERYTRTGNVGDRLKEAANINTSLLTLGRCIQLLRQNQISKLNKDRVIPFRESKLTRLFQTFFSGKGKACMFVNISPAASAFDENINALKFSALAKQVQFIEEKKPELPQKLPPRSALSIALAQEDAGSGRDSIPWATQEEISAVDKMPTLEEEQAGDADVSSYAEAIEKLKGLLLQTTEELRKEKKAKKTLESQLRSEICKEMMAQITEIENHYEQELEDERQRLEEAAEKKINMVTAAINKSVKRKRQEYEDEIKGATVSLAVFEAEKVKLERREAEIEDLQRKIENLTAQITSLQESKEKPGSVTKVETAEIGTSPEEDNSKAELQTQLEEFSVVNQNLESKISVLESELQSMREHSDKRQSDSDIASNEIFITVTKQLEEVKGTLADKESEIAELKSTLDEAGEEFYKKNEEISTLKQKLSETEASQQETKAELQARSETVATLRTEIEELKTKIQASNEELQTLNKQHQVQIKELEMEVIAVSKGLQSSDKEKESIEKQLAEFKTVFEQVKFDLDEKVILLNSASEEKTHLEQQIDSRMKEYDSLVSEMEQLKQTMNSVGDKVTDSEEMETKCRTLTDNMKRLQEQLRRRSLELQGDMGTVQTQLFSTKKELERVKRDKERSDKCVNELEKQLQDQRKLYTEMKQKLEKVEEDLEVLKENTEEIQDSHNTLSSTHAKLEAEYNEIKQVKEDLESETKNLRVLLQKSEGQASTLESTIYQLRKQINQSDSKASQIKISDNEDTLINELKMQLADRDSHIQELKDELATNQAAIADLNAHHEKFSSLAGRVKEITETLEQQKKLYEEATTRIRDLSAENSKLKECSGNQADKNLEEEVEKLKADLASKESKADSLRVILDARQSEWDRKEGCYTTAKEELEQAKIKAQSLKENNELLQKELSTQSDELTALQEKLKTAAQTALDKEAEMTSTLSSLERTVSSLKSELKETIEKAENSASEKSTKENIIKDLRSAIEELENTMKVQDEVIEAKEQEIHSLNQEVADLQKKLEQTDILISDNENLSKQLYESKQEKATLEDANCSLTLQIRNLNMELKKAKESDDKIDASSDIEIKDKEIRKLKDEMKQWQADKDDIVAELEQILTAKDKKIAELKSSQAESSGDDNAELSKRIDKLEEQVARKNSIILQLEQKIRSQEAQLQNTMGRTSRTRVTRSSSDEAMRIKTLEEELEKEITRHAETQGTLDRVLRVKDEQVAELKEANGKLQKEIERFEETIHTTTSSRPSDRFKEPTFSNDDELTASNLELDVTPMSAKKKRSTRSSARRSTRQSTSTKKDKENLPATKSAGAFKRLQTMVESSTSSLASPAKKLLVHLSPLRAEKSGGDTLATPTEPEPEEKRGRRRRKLYTLDETKLVATPGEEPESSSKKSKTSVHQIVTRNLRSMSLK